MRGLAPRLPKGKKGVIVIFAAVLVLGGIGGVIKAALGGAPSNQTSGDIELQRGLVGWWKMDGNAKDSTPYGANGSLTGTGATTDREGLASGALSFNGTTDAVTVGDLSQLKITGSQTISLWLKPSDFSARRNPYAKAYGGEGTITQETNGTVNYYYGTAGSNNLPYQGFTMSSALSLNTWVHLVIVRDLSGMTLTWYKNGSQTDQAAASYSAAVASTFPLYIGKGYVSNYAGSIDDVRVYNRALSANEVTALYQSYGSGAAVASGNNNLLGWWKFDGNAKDSSPYANNGTTTTGSTLTTDREGLANGAYAFSGTAPSYITMGNSTVFNSSEVTFSAWVKPSIISGYQTIIAKELQYKYRISPSGNVEILVSRNGTSWAINTGFTASLTAGNWYNIATTISSTSNLATVYVNGASIGSIALGGSITAFNSNPLLVGTYNVSSGEPFHGSIDDVRIYGRALSAAEISQGYSSYNPKVQISDFQKGLVGDWPLNGNAKDNTPYSNNGTVSGAVLTTDRKGRTNSAYSLNGTSNSITVSGSSFPTSAITISVWVDIPSATGGPRLVNNNWVSPEGSWLMYVPGGASSYAFFGIYHSSSQYPAHCASGSFTANVWHHIVGMYDGSTVKAYYDGSLCTTTTSSISGVTLYNGGNVQIAAPNGGSPPSYLIDDVRVWNRALSAAEVSALYQSYR
ncbi:hypothetical protein COU91_03630 [Candidatus Saccharibacteria bacterium CG10_big_fil_rev_8_21_14_0_10_47_8]|nr:MAG: hypothetical protein COU91_03630 [Candidatus Saccharibacteria bacterium CG10_big_fil_rev_8_21_14_0_10_47_8]